MHKNTKHLKEGGVEIFSDYEKIVNRIDERLLNNCMKATEGLQDRLALIYEIINLIKTMKVRVFVDYVDSYSKGKITIKDNLGKFLIKKYDSTAKKARV